ncbi:Amino acid permease 1, partial [Mucuna pruriens]
MAQLGWIIGICSILLFAIVNLYTSNLLTDCYRSPHPVTGKRNYSYMETVRSNLGGKMYIISGFVQYSNLVGPAIGYTITTAISAATIRKVNCFHQNGTANSCRFSTNPYMIGFGIVQIILSQIPNFHKLSWLSILAATMSFGYASIGAGLSLATVIHGKGKSTSLTGSSKIQSTSKNLLTKLVALGNIALATGYSQIALEIQDSLRSSPPENKAMKRANKMGISTMTIFFLTCACSGYAAFGTETPGNILLSSGFKEPFWLIDLANVFIMVHLVGAYQVVLQPIFRVVETWASQRWPNSCFINGEYPMNIGKMKFSISFFRVVWRSILVVILTILAMAMPFFNDMLALLGGIGFWPLTIYFPVEMYIARKKIKKGTRRWFGLKTMSLVFMLLAMGIVCAAILGLNEALHKYHPFKYKV